MFRRFYSVYRKLYAFRIRYQFVIRQIRERTLPLECMLHHRTLSSDVRSLPILHAARSADKSQAVNENSPVAIDQSLLRATDEPARTPASARILTFEHKKKHTR